MSRARGTPKVESPPTDSLPNVLPDRSLAVLTLTTGMSRDCDRVSRRSFLQVGALAGLGISLPLALAARKARAATGAGANCILIWTRGGTSHHDTFDPK